MTTPVTITWVEPKLSTPDSKIDPLALDGFDHIEIWSGNARQAAYYYEHAFGFTPVAYRGPETGFRDAVSYVLQQYKVTIVITTPLLITHPAHSQIQTHGDFVKCIGLMVPDCALFYAEVMKRGAESIEPPMKHTDGDGSIVRAAIRTYGDTIHALIERKLYNGIFAPGFRPYSEIFPHHVPATETNISLRVIDHIVGNVELGKMNQWVNFYQHVLGFTQLQQFSDKDISTEYSALMSKVMTNGSGKIKFPINEPAQGRKKSQIEEYLDFNHGPGVQHVALLTGDIISTVTTMRSRGVTFLKVPKTYYDEIPKRVGAIKEDLKRIAELGILVDRDEDGYLLQIFTKPVQDRPTLFFEIIQRQGSQGFGIGNFKALFEAIERDQAERGNL